MGKMFDALPDKDKIEFYLNAFSGRENATSGAADLNYILRFWERNKEKFYHAFGDQFILRKEISYSRPIDEIEKDIHRLRYKSEFINTYKNWVFDRYDKFLDELREVYDHNEEAHRKYQEIVDERDYCLSLTDPDYIARSEYEGRSFVLSNTPEGVTIKVQRGCKPMRILGKIAQTFGIEGFEEFRIAVSQVLNQKKISGTFCLSIHPLDFMTMSDNECDWHSCMNWMNGGEYRMGTVEMMNSPVVVVGYLESKNPMTFGPYEWNNKKWRNLFIITDDLITSVKDYPYHNEVFCDQMVNWLRDIFGVTSYKEPEHIFCDGEYIEYEDYCFNMISNAMYNDFGNSAYVSCAFAVDGDSTGDIVYSGPAECMNCGGALDAEPGVVEGITDMSDLVCDECADVRHCDWCGGRMYGSDNTYEVDGSIICEDCYENNTSVDFFTDEVHMESNMESVLLLKEDIGDKVAERESYYDLKSISYYGPDQGEYFSNIRTGHVASSWGHWVNTFTYIIPEDIEENWRDNVSDDYWRTVDLIEN